MDAAAGQITPNQQGHAAGAAMEMQKKNKKSACLHKKTLVPFKASQNSSFIFYRHIFADLILKLFFYC